MTVEEDARARADRDFATALAALAEDARTAPEWSVGTRFNGSRLITPKRAIAAGMLAFLRGDDV